MMRYHGRKHARSGERGVTMIIVVIAMLSMLALVALAIDVITLYAARSEAQRAADGAALAAAKMLVDAGVTADPANAALQTTAQGFATTIAQNVAQQAAISGQQVQAANVTVAFGAANFGINPTVTVTVQSGNLPTFFSRIWSRAALTVGASATAEAFNPSNSSSVTAGVGVPIVARCVKPFLLPNCDPVNTNNPGSNCGAAVPRFFDPTTGAIINPGQTPTGLIGESFNLSSNCGAGPGCIPGPPVVSAPAVFTYYPAQMPAAASGNACPSACGGGGTNFENDIECCNPSPISCGTAVTPPVVNTLAPDLTVFPDGGGGPAETGVQCLIHQDTGTTGQDILNDNVAGPLNYPLEIQAGADHPLSAVLGGSYITTSDSLITVPVYEPPVGGAAPGGSVNIIGFLQLFIVQSFPAGGGPKAGSFTATVVNVSGCGSNATGTPVYTGGSSAVPVRLIHQ